jgi:hypothetical protein
MPNYIHVLNKAERERSSEIKQRIIQASIMVNGVQNGSKPAHI